MEDGDTEKYYPSRVIHDFVFLIRERGCIRCFSLHVYNNFPYHHPPCFTHLTSINPNT